VHVCVFKHVEEHKSQKQGVRENELAPKNKVTYRQ
jgi:hypothetical protein